MATVTPDNAIRMVQVVKELHEEVAQLLHNYGYKQSANSQANRELQTFQRQESIATTYSQGAVLEQIPS